MTNNQNNFPEGYVYALGYYVNFSKMPEWAVKEFQSYINEIEEFLKAFQDNKLFLRDKNKFYFKTLEGAFACRMNFSEHLKFYEKFENNEITKHYLG